MVNSFQFTRAVRLPDAPKDAKDAKDCRSGRCYHNEPNLEWNGLGKPLYPEAIQE